MSDVDEAAGILLELHDACICCILTHASSAADLAKVQVVCRRLSSLGVTNKLWFKWLYADFGLVVAPAGLPTASASCPTTGAAQRLYRKLRTKKACHALHVEAISTDGSCDEPHDAYWADHMFTYKRSVMYCSASDTKDIHVFGRLSPKRRPLPDIPQQLTVSPAALSEPQQRAFLLDRCTRVAMRLIHPVIYEAYHTELQQIEQSGGLQVEATPAAAPVQQGGLLGMILRRITGSTAEMEKANSVRTILNPCSTEGLVEFFLESFIAQTQGKSWAAPLYSGLDDDGLQMVRWMAFNEYQNALAPRSQQRLEEHKWPPVADAASSAPDTATSQPRPWPQSSSAGAAARTDSGRLCCGTAGSRRLPQQCSLRRRQRQLLCADEQLELLMANTSPADNLCLIRSCIFARDGTGGNTCPISSGILYLAHYYKLPQPAAQVNHGTVQQSDRDTPLAAAAESAAAVQVLGELTEQSWTSASDGLTTALAVLTACAAGKLPAMLDYACNQQAEWVEFVQPTTKQIKRQWQLHQQQAGMDGGSTSGGCNGLGGADSVCVMCPVLWFRFYPGQLDLNTPAAAALVGQEGLPVGLPGAGLNPAAPGVWVDLPPEHAAPAAAAADMPAPWNAAASHTAASDTAAAQAWGVGAAAEGVQAAQDTQQQQQQQQQHEHDQLRHPYRCAQSNSMAATRASTSPGAIIMAAKAAAQKLKPRKQLGSALCDAAPDLPAVCCEVSAALGYLPTDNQLHRGYLSVQLQQPRAANLVCMKLLNSEDVNPEFNQERGGCNIDMQLVMLRGHELEPLPAGLAVSDALRSDEVDA